MPLKPGYLALAGAGAIVAVSGVRGWALGHTFRDIIAGSNPSAHPQSANLISGASFGYGLTGATGSGVGGGSAGGQGIASLAESAIGFPYGWGAAPATGKADCSSFANMIIGHYAGLSIPGWRNGSYPWTQHGPNTVIWLAWLGTGISRVPRNQVQPGDLAIWQTHMGIIVNQNEMVSDLWYGLNTQKTGIEAGGPKGEVLVCARLKQLSGPPRPPGHH